MTEAIQITISGIVEGTVYALLALGFSLVYRVTGVINLAQGGFCILGALCAYSFEVTFGLPTIVAVLGAIAVVTAAGTALGAVTFVPGLPRLSHSSMLMLTAGLLWSISGVTLLVWGSQPYSLPTFSGEHPVHVMGLLIPTQGFWVLGTAVVIVIGLRTLLMRSTLGQALRACAENPVAARLVGIGVPRMALLSFGLAAAIGATAGIMVAPLTNLQFDSGNNLTIYGFIAVAIGGIGSFPGAIAGGLLLGIVTQLATAYISSLFASALALGMLFVVLLFRPAGLLSVGRARRTDVRDDQAVWRGIVRLLPSTAWSAAALALAVGLAMPWLVPDGMMSSVVITGILFIAAMGLDVLMGYTGQVSLGQAGFMAIGGYTAASMAVNLALPPWLGLLAGIVISALSALALALITMRLRGLYLALATLAFGLLTDSLAIGLTPITGGPSGLVGIPSFSIGSLDFSDPVWMYYLVLAIIVAVGLMLAGALRSRFGRALQAIRTDQMAAAALGIKVERYKIGAFVISAILASIAGSLYAFFFHYLSPDMVATQRSLDLVTMVALGGEGTLVGPLFGVALLTIMPDMFQALRNYKTLASGGLLVLVFLYLPDGIFGALARLLTFKKRQPRPPGLASLAGSGT